MRELCFKMVRNDRWALVSQGLRKYQSVDTMKYTVTKNGVVQFEGSNTLAGRYFRLMTAEKF